MTSLILPYLNISYPHMGPPTTPGPQARAYARGGLGVKPPHELDILQYLYYLRKGN